MQELSVPADPELDSFDTILLDMDGTVLDLAFDNYFWRELVPRCLARRLGVAPEEARENLFARYAEKEGSLDWYCLDYWSDELELDLLTLKHASSHRIRFLPGARDFLLAARARHKRLVLVTNAHHDALAMKKAVAGLSAYFECFVSSHEFGYAKEDSRFWDALRAVVDFEPTRTLFVDDSLTVLHAAKDCSGLTVVAISRPDTSLPVREIEDFPVVEGVGQFVGSTRRT